MARTVYTEKRGEPVLKKLLQVRNCIHTTCSNPKKNTLDLGNILEQFVHWNWKGLILKWQELDIDKFKNKKRTLQLNVMEKSRYHEVHFLQIYYNDDIFFH